MPLNESDGCDMTQTECEVVKLSNLRGLARRLRLPAAWLEAEAKAGRIPCLRAGRRTLYNPEAVERVLLERAASMPTDEGVVRRGSGGQAGSARPVKGADCG